ncbi:hypothetical protein E2562_024113 [Oryza meyeriana var. granulata]|uniref:Inosine/uridine-preferring nucleoside hydrolase domain-containing protein n=1 Tax=Oryza meyeriana var. granulata TaxID=110450 RepID=A0A6G1EP44_9ORYZ|nr:hypothetical protein E2562_024113 [Oryza meyeriana var. granulata]
MTPLPRRTATAVVLLVVVATVIFAVVAATPRRILVDTDMDTDDLFALLYLLKQNRSEFELKVSGDAARGVQYILYIYNISSFVHFLFS